MARNHQPWPALLAAAPPAGGWARPQDSPPIRPWFLAALTLAVAVLTAFPLGRHLWQVFNDRPQPAWDSWLAPLETALLRWIGDRGQPAATAWACLQPFLVANACFGGLALHTTFQKLQVSNRTQAVLTFHHPS